MEAQRLSNSRTFGWEFKLRVRHLRHQHHLELTSVKTTPATRARFITLTRLTTGWTRVNTTEVRNLHRDFLASQQKRCVRYCPRNLYTQQFLLILFGFHPVTNSNCSVNTVPKILLPTLFDGDSNLLPPNTNSFVEIPLRSPISQNSVMLPRKYDGSKSEMT